MAHPSTAARVWYVPDDEREEAANALANKRLIVDENDADHAGCGAREGSQASTVNPDSPPVRTANFPPRYSTRSRIPRRPEP